MRENLLEFQFFRPSRRSHRKFFGTYRPKEYLSRVIDKF